MFGSLYKLQSSPFHLGCQQPPSCVGPYILHNIFLSNVFSTRSAVCVSVQVTLTVLYISIFKMQKTWKKEGDSGTNLSYIKTTTEFFQEHKKRSQWDEEK